MASLWLSIPFGMSHSWAICKMWLVKVEMAGSFVLNTSCPMLGEFYLCFPLYPKTGPLPFHKRQTDNGGGIYRFPWVLSICSAWPTSPSTIDQGSPPLLGSSQQGGHTQPVSLRSSAPNSCSCVVQIQCQSIPHILWQIRFQLIPHNFWCTEHNLIKKDIRGKLCLNHLFLICSQPLKGDRLWYWTGLLAWVRQVSSWSSKHFAPRKAFLQRMKFSIKNKNTLDSHYSQGCTVLLHQRPFIMQCITELCPLWTARGRSGKGRRQKGSLILYSVPYSEHSSFAELREFVQWLQPSKIVPTVGNDRGPKTSSMLSMLRTWAMFNQPDLVLPTCNYIALYIACGLAERMTRGAGQQNFEGQKKVIIRKLFSFTCREPLKHTRFNQHKTKIADWPCQYSHATDKGTTSFWLGYALLLELCWGQVVGACVSWCGRIIDAKPCLPFQWLLTSWQTSLMTIFACSCMRTRCIV